MQPHKHAHSHTHVRVHIQVHTDMFKQTNACYTEMCTQMHTTLIVTIQLNHFLVVHPLCHMALRRWDADADDDIQLVRYDASSSSSASSDVEERLLGCKLLAMNACTEHTYIQTCTCTCTCTCVHTYVHACIHTYIHIYIYLNMIMFYSVVAGAKGSVEQL